MFSLIGVITAQLVTRKHFGIMQCWIFTYVTDLSSSKPLVCPCTYQRQLFMQLINKAFIRISVMIEEWSKPCLLSGTWACRDKRHKEREREEEEQIMRGKSLTRDLSKHASGNLQKLMRKTERQKEEEQGLFVPWLDFKISSQSGSGPWALSQGWLMEGGKIVVQTVTFWATITTVITFFWYFMLS